MDTSTSFLGFRLPHPFIAGASPLGFDLDTIKRLEDGGCAAIVIPSLFEEQITLAATGRIHQRDPLDAEWAVALAHFPAPTPTRSRRTVRGAHRAREARRGHSGHRVAQRHVRWIVAEFSRIIEQAGADALELNLYRGRHRLERPGQGRRARADEHGQRVEAAPENSHRRENFPVLRGVRPRRAAARRRRAPTASSCSTASTSPTSTRPP